MHTLGFVFVGGVKYRLLIPAFTVSEHSPGLAAKVLNLLGKKEKLFRVTYSQNEEICILCTPRHNISTKAGFREYITWQSLLSVH